VYLLSGGTVGPQVLPTGAWATVEAWAYGQRLGAALDAGGDADGDGVGDVLAGAPGGDGFACVLPGSLLPDFDWDGVVGQVYGGPDAHLGASVALPGDVDGDGYDDVSTGAPASGAGGAVVLVLGPLAGPVAQDDADVVLVAEGAGDALGVVARVGDLDGDGRADLAVGAPDALAGAGAAWVLVGDPAGWGGLVDAALEVEGAGATGTALAACDLDGDGWPDLALGSPGAASGDGRVAVLYGPVADPGGVVAAGDGSLQVRSPAPGGTLGTALAAAPDLDGDGVADLLAGAPAAASEAGAATLLLGRGF